MKYIVLDLEWNQSSGGPASENPRLPFEVIEIGAAKLDSKYKILDQYGSIIKPRLYRKLQSHIKEILSYDENFLKTGRPFDVVYREFKKWCGEEDFMFCTWGPLDLTYLQQNMDFYYLKPLEFPLKYIDLQEVYADIYYGDKSKTPSLEKAVTELNIPIEEAFHCAKNDAYYTAMILQKMKPRKIEDRFKLDYYRHPESVEDEIFITRADGTEYITRPFEDKFEAMDDKKVTEINCYKCGKKLKKKIKWFVNSSNIQLSVGKCWNHGLTCGKIRFKNTSDGKVFVVKTMERIDRKKYESIKHRQEELRIRRRDKRKHKKEMSH